MRADERRRTRLPGHEEPARATAGAALARDDARAGLEARLRHRRRDEEARRRRAARRPPAAVAGASSRARSSTSRSWGNPKLEPEIVARAGEDGEITAIGAAIELADIDPGAGDPEAILAANIFQRHVLLGPVTPLEEGASVAGVAAARQRQR